MNNIILAFSQDGIAQSIKKILGQSGYNVVAVCQNGAQALNTVSNLETGIVICGYRMVDMMYSELYEYLPNGFQMIMIASASNILEKEVKNLICLSMPLKIHELLQTLEMMEGQIIRYRRKMRSRPKKRSEEDKRIIEKAKACLMEKNGFTEDEAHRYIQKRSMEDGTELVEISQMILSLLQGG